MPTTAPRRTALAWAKAQWDKRVAEHPAGSNRGHPVEDWQKAFGSYLVGLAWCGVFVGTALKQAGVKITARVASVALIEDDARAGRNGFEKLVSWDEALPGDVLILFDRGVHTEILAWPHRRLGYVTTYGGNTSYEGKSGSQSNGGCVAKRHRTRSDVYAIARPRYPAK
jgi:hypothetical protein